MNQEKKQFISIEKQTLEAPLIKVPKFFHDILGESIAGSQIVVILLGTFLMTAILWQLGIQQLFVKGISISGVFVLLLSVDIVAGAIANLTKGTNDYYAQRPLNRLIFIVIHIQPLLLFGLTYRSLGYEIMGPQGAFSVKFWIYVLVTGLIVNGFNSEALGHRFSRRHQGTVAMVFVVLGIGSLFGLKAELAPWLQMIYGVYLIKVVYSFSVNHYPDPVASLDFKEVSQLIDEAFKYDPLYNYVLVDEVKKATFTRIICLKTYFLSNQLRVVREEDGSLLGITSFGVERPMGSSSFNFGLWGLMQALLLDGLLGKISLKGLYKMNDYMRVSETLKPKDAHVYIYFVAVSPQAQGRGIGKALLESAEDFAKSKDLFLLALDTENKTNVALYQHMGYCLNGSKKIDSIEVYSCYKPL